MQLFFVSKARLVLVKNARRFVGLVVLSLFALPLGLSVTGCGHKATPVVYCYAGDSGPVVGQVATITLSSSLATTGESLNYGQMGQALSATAIDCKGNAVSVRSYTYSSTSSFGANTNGGPIFADINPNTGQVCGGTWNRNTGGGIADYTTCTAPSSAPVSTSAVALSVTNPTPTAGATATLVLGQANDTVSGTLYLGLGSAVRSDRLYRTGEYHAHRACRPDQCTDPGHARRQPAQHRSAGSVCRRHYRPHPVPHHHRSCRCGEYPQHHRHRARGQHRLLPGVRHSLC